MSRINLLICTLVFLLLPFTASPQEPQLKSAITGLGFKVTWKVSAAASDWELRDFRMRSKQIFSIKSLKRVPGERSLYYRYTIRVEDYANESDALRRVQHIEATPPGPDSKMLAPEHALRVGFLRGNRVFVVATDVYTFVADGSLNRFLAELDSRTPR